MPIAHLDEVDIAYGVHGKGDPLLLIMGVAGTKEVWTFQIRAFAAHYRVVTFDNRGAGKTRAASQPLTLEAMAADTVGLLDALGISSTHLLGYSLGGIIAQEVAIRYPERVRKLILAATTAVGPGTEDTSTEMQQAIGLETDGAGAQVRQGSFAGVLPRLARLAFGKPVIRALIGPLARIYSWRTGSAGIAGQMQAPASADTLGRLGQIRAQTLVITGTGDRLVPPRSSQVLAGRIPGARLVLVEGGSHAFVIEMYRRFNQEVLRFLAEEAR
jgi:3-oxoadipate enol-lactonase